MTNIPKSQIPHGYPNIPVSEGQYPNIPEKMANSPISKIGLTWPINDLRRGAEKIKEKNQRPFSREKNLKGPCSEKKNDLKPSLEGKKKYFPPRKKIQGLFIGYDKGKKFQKALLRKNKLGFREEFCARYFL